MIMRGHVRFRIESKRLQTPTAEACTAMLACQRNALASTVVGEGLATLDIRTAQREQLIGEHLTRNHKRKLEREAANNEPSNANRYHHALRWRSCARVHVAN